MALKRLVQAAMAAFVLAAAVPASAQQVLKVGSTPTGVPFTFLDTKTNSIQGIMVDLITEIGKDAGFKVQIEPMQFSTLIASLTSNKIDIISAAMFVTPARKEVIDFSDTGTRVPFAERIYPPPTANAANCAGFLYCSNIASRYCCACVRFNSRLLSIRYRAHRAL
jgi:ABC-type amino acid transport substrate-binding protein